MNFKEFSNINWQRCKKWHDPYQWSIADWAVALSGEVGELCNLIKKLKRIDTLML